MLIVTDVCLCEYTSHGHCGILRDREVDNDATLDVLSQVALLSARAGADLVAPSDMMDGRVGAIRACLDESGFSQVGILAYSAKYCSAFYGPFRDAADSAPQFGDRRAYQMDFFQCGGKLFGEVSPGHRRRGGHGDGQTGPGVPGCHPEG